ncbi:hypothetical protein ABZS66_19965 [Dactylosporangium sp. NPDC005572]|uniref:hypothetical protein n=1 Tax=Dactylosporangium sp. NPDC005572 TaxID=3156889 RepID=UPI0033ADCCBE
MDREHGLRRATGITGLLAALGVAGTLAVATVAYAARPEDQETGNEQAVTSTDDASGGSSWPQLTDDSSSDTGTSGGHATTGGS